MNFENESEEIINLLKEVNEFSWIKISFLVEKIKEEEEEFNLNEIIEINKEIYQNNFKKNNKNNNENNNENNNLINHQNNLFNLLINKTKPITSNKSNIVNFLQQYSLKNKIKVNCFGFALVSYLICICNQIRCQFYSSETHSWIRLLDNNQIIDVQDNIKIAKKSKKPLSIYHNEQVIDSFGLCMMIICNENSLIDEEVYKILHHYRDQLKYSWEISKYFSLAHELSSSSSSSSSLQTTTTTTTTISTTISTENPSLVIELPPLSLLDTISNSLELTVQKCIFYLDNGRYDELFDILTTRLFSQTQELCETYQINSDLFFDPEISIFALATEIFEKYQELQLQDNDFIFKYEKWIEMNVELISRTVSIENGEKWRRIAPVLNGKRRRIEKSHE